MGMTESDRNIIRELEADAAPTAAEWLAECKARGICPWCAQGQQITGWDWQKDTPIWTTCEHCDGEGTWNE